MRSSSRKRIARAGCKTLTSAWSRHVAATAVSVLTPDVSPYVERRLRADLVQSELTERADSDDVRVMLRLRCEENPRHYCVTVFDGVRASRSNAAVITFPPRLT